MTGTNCDLFTHSPGHIWTTLYMTRGVNLNPHPRFSAQVLNEWRYTSASPIRRHDMYMIGFTFVFFTGGTDTGTVSCTWRSQNSEM
jgi:hypothetical protein